MRQSGKPTVTRSAAIWFAATGILNGSAVLLMYAALNMAPVWMVAPAVVSTAVLRDEKLSLRAAAGAGITVAAVAYLVGSHAGS